MRWQSRAVTPPSVEPVTLEQVRAHLRLDSTSFADNVTSSQTIAPGSHTIAAAYSLVGLAVDVLESQAVVLLQSGTNGAGGTVDVKLQDSDDGITWADVADGAFTQVTTANDNATQEKSYNGARQYIRAVSTVAVAACEFGVSVVLSAPELADGDLLTALITTAREMVERETASTLISTTRDYWQDGWPRGKAIQLPYSPLLSVTGVYWKDTDGTEATLTAGTDYLVDTDSEPGRIVLAHGGNWPSGVLYPVNPIRVRYVAGYGETAASVPRPLRQAVLLTVGDLYENREGFIQGAQVHMLPIAAKYLSLPYVMWLSPAHANA